MGSRGRAWPNANIKVLLQKQINFKKIAFVIQTAQITMLYHFSASRDLKEALTSFFSIWGRGLCAVLVDLVFQIDFLKMFIKDVSLRRWRHVRMVAKSFLTADLNSSPSSAPLSRETWGK